MLTYLDMKLCKRERDYKSGQREKRQHISWNAGKKNTGKSKTRENMEEETPLES